MRILSSSTVRTFYGVYANCIKIGIRHSQNLKRTTFERVNVLGFLFCVDILDCNLLSINRSIFLSNFDKVFKHGRLRSLKYGGNFGITQPVLPTFERNSHIVRQI